MQKSFPGNIWPGKINSCLSIIRCNVHQYFSKSNVTLFRRYEIENDLPVGNYLPNIQDQLRLIRSGQPLSGRKINAFARAMAGDQNAVVVDIWLLRAFDL